MNEENVVGVGIAFLALSAVMVGVVAGLSHYMIQRGDEPKNNPGIGLAAVFAVFDAAMSVLWFTGVFS